MRPSWAETDEEVQRVIAALDTIYSRHGIKFAFNETELVCQIPEGVHPKNLKENCKNIASEELGRDVLFKEFTTIPLPDLTFGS